jgi:protease I
VKALRAPNTEATVIAPHAGFIQGMNHHDKGDMLPVDRTLVDTTPDQFDGLGAAGRCRQPG